jgi:hypothetical protein
MPKTLKHNLTIGSRVVVTDTHQWMPGRFGIIKRVENRIGNRFLVKFDSDERGVWHDEDGDPVLRLGDGDLIPIGDGYFAEDDSASDVLQFNSNGVHETNSEEARTGFEPHSGNALWVSTERSTRRQ